MSLSSSTEPSTPATSISQERPRLLKAALGETLDRPPVWMMRQAGRYMAEYQAMRKKYTFLELCKNVDAAVEVSLQPILAFGMDGCIMFSDILIPPEAMGMALEFTEGKGPQFLEPLRHKDQVARLLEPDPVETMGFVANILKQLRRELEANHPGTTLLGFAGAPWTLASYMIEGGGSKHFIHLKRWMVEDPAAFHALLEKVTRVVIAYMNMQIEAGAQAVQLFDSWAGVVSADTYREFILPYHQKVFAGLQSTGPDGQPIPKILYVNGSRGIIPEMAASGADVLSIDWMTSINDARAIAGPQFAYQGNLDPALLFANPDQVLPHVKTLIQEGGPTGYIFNLGHGILPKTPVETVRAVVNTVKSWQF